MSKVKMSLVLPEDLKSKLEIAARYLGQDQSSLVAEVLRQYLSALALDSGVDFGEEEKRFENKASAIQKAAQKGVTHQSMRDLLKRGE